jgi:hypothetical protein
MLSWEHWQREQVNEFVFQAYNAVTAAKPWVKLSASVIGKYTGRGWSSYDVVYQDPRRWMEVGKIDFIVPMVYWERSHPTHPFIPLITQWQDRVAYDRQVVPGLSTGLITKLGWEEISAEIEEVRKKGLPGIVFFAAGGLERSWGILGVQEFPYWSIVPKMEWKDSVAPPPPSDLKALGVTGGVQLEWITLTLDEPLSYVIYRSHTPVLSTTDVSSIVTVTGRNVTSYFDAQVPEGDWYYIVTALDRLANESTPSVAAKVQRAAVAARINVE